MKRAFAILIAAMISGCNTPQTPETPQAWNKSDIVDHEFVLISTNRIEQFMFGSNGIVLATLGTPTELCGVGLSWQLNRRGALIIHDESTAITLQKMRMGDERIEVLRNGEAATYRTMKKK